MNSPIESVGIATETLPSLVSTIATTLGRRPVQSSGIEAELADLEVALQAANPRPGFVASPHRYAHILSLALAEGGRRGVSEVSAALAAVQDVLPWCYSYADADAVNLAGRIGFGELIGPDGPLWAPDVRVGFTLVAPGTVYPPHAHPAVEMYWVIAGNAEWSADGGTRIAAPGEFILHRSGEAHAMRTLDEPLLALWHWSGDIDTPAFYV